MEEQEAVLKQSLKKKTALKHPKFLLAVLLSCDFGLSSFPSRALELSRAVYSYAAIHQDPELY